MNITKKINNWDVLTPKGWSKFSGIKKIEKEYYYKITFSDNSELKCSENHKIKMINSEFKYAIELSVEDKVYGDLEIIEINLIEEKCELYDLLDVEKDNEYFTNNVISHNCAFVDKIEDIWVAAYPSLSTGGRAILLSTPAGEGNFFHKMVVGAENHDNEFALSKLYWWMRPDYNNEKWKRVTIANLCAGDINKFLSEYECSFISSSKSVVPINKLNELIRKNATNNIKKLEKFVTKQSNTYENLDIYELPKENSIYMIVCDTAEGLGDPRDASAFLILNITENKIIGNYADKDIKERDLANLLNDIGLTYNNALMVLEIRSTGLLVAQYLIELKYPNIFWSDRRSGLFLDETSPIKIVNQFSNKDKNAIPGFYTTSKNKIILVNEMKNIIIDNEIEILSTPLLEQLKYYISKGNLKYGADGKNNDDMVAALIIGLYIKKLYWKLIENNNLLTDEILKFFIRDITKATDNKSLADVIRFAPVWKTGKHQTLYDPYNSNKILGDLRCFLDEKK